MGLIEIRGNSVNEITLQAAKHLLTDGSRINSRNGMTYEECDINLVCTNPRNRHMYLEGRTNNIYAAIAETFWVLSGKSELDPVMNFFLPRAKDYSDNGVTWTNAYGPKLYTNGNLQNVITSFINDGPNTRRAVMAIWTPQTDTIHSLLSKGIHQPKDISCNNFVYFWIRDNKLNMKVTVRSNDLIFGYSAINHFEWTVLQECVLECLRNYGDPRFSGLQLGYYNQSIISLHVYDATAKQAQSMVELEERNWQLVNTSPDTPPITLSTRIKSAEDIKSLFTDLYNEIAEVTQGRGGVVENVLDDYGIPEESTLRAYAKITEGYAYEKMGMEYTGLRDVSPLIPADLMMAMARSKFTPKEWQWIISSPLKQKLQRPLSSNYTTLNH